MIVGMKGVGKTLLALQIARMLLCENADKKATGCGHCRGCQLFHAQTHPDFLTVAPLDEKKNPLTITILPKQFGKEIGIDTVRALSQSLTLKSHYGGYRVALLTPADSMTTQAENSLLKTLEEPEDGTVLLLLTGTIAALPATITSRCLRVVVQPPERTVALEWLLHHCSADMPSANQLETVLAVSGNAPLSTIKMVDEGSLERQQQFFQGWLKLARQQTDPVTLGEQWLKEDHQQIVDWISRWLIDMIKLKHGLQQTRLYNSAWSGELQQQTHNVELQPLYRLLDQVYQAKRLLTTSANPQLLLEALLIDWQQLTAV